MAVIPDIIRDKKAETRQGWCYGGAVLTGLGTWGAFSSGDPETGLILGGITAGLVYVGSKIKTKYRRTRSAHEYR